MNAAKILLVAVMLAFSASVFADEAPTDLKNERRLAAGLGSSNSGDFSHDEPSQFIERRYRFAPPSVSLSYTKSAYIVAQVENEYAVHGALGATLNDS